MKVSRFMTQFLRRFLSFGLLALGLTLCSAALTSAAPGDLDPSFGNGGKVVTSIGNGAGANAMAIQSDGKIVVAGSSNNGADSDFALARYNTDGSLDNTFGTGGKVTTPVTLSDFATGVAIQPDGKIVAVGVTFSSSPNSDDFAVVRYNADGSLDTSFGTGGKVITPIGSANDSAYAVAIQSDGKIVVAGRSYNGTTYAFALVRYNTNGILDSTFGTGGKVVTVIRGDGMANSLVIQPDGKIVAVGRSTSAINIDYALARYNTNGSLDSSFGTGGIVTTEVGSRNDIAYAAAIQPDGKIVVTGISNYLEFTGTFYSLARYNTDGSLDVSFGTNGTVTTQIGGSSNERANGVAIQLDGKIVVVGITYSDNSSTSVRSAVVRYNANGSLDTSFGTGGKVITQIGSYNGAGGVAIQVDGKIVVAGYSNNGTNNDFALVRYLAASNIRTRFDYEGDGKADISVFRPSNGAWYLLNSSSGFTGVQFGAPTDKITPADFDGDGKTDIAVFRDGIWYWLNSSNGSFSAVQFGQAGDIPVPADYSGDGRAEIAVYRGGFWYTLNLADNQFQGVQFGYPTDKPVPADYDGDGKTDVAVVRQAGGTSSWYILGSTQGFYGLQFGTDTDKPVPADYDGDGKSDQAVYRNGVWYVLGSTQGFYAVQFGISSDIPVAADYDGDGKTDVAVYRDGIWYMLRSQQGFGAVQFGTTNDKPIPAAFVP